MNQAEILSLTHVKDPIFDGEFSEIKIMYRAGGQRIFLLGLGGEKDLNKCDEAFRKLAYTTGKYWTNKIQVDCSKLKEKEIIQVVTGLEMANYKLGVYKSDEEKVNVVEVALCTEKNVSRQILEGMYIGEAINRVKTLVDAPANYKTPEFIADWAVKSGKENSYETKVWNEEDLEEQGFDAILAVGNGSKNPPRLIEVSYMPRKNDAVDFGLVGKGITFDSGGLSIKASTNLHYMKSDMGGAAVVLGVIELAAKLKLNVNIVGVVASAENAVDANSYRPGDVINSYSGKTIEIIDTDAEGRLVLADAMSYIIRTHHPDQIIDLATLTGSVVRTLGYSAAGLFTKNKEMSDTLSQIGESLNEKVWPLPLYDEFESDLHSDIADIRNFSGKPIAGGINAAKFIEAFTESHKKWVHLDIAGVAFGDSSYAKMKSASGYGIRLMIEYIRFLERQHEQKTT
jgi:leucyl aminopeptidase